jgi:hypothetical protein
MAEPKYKSKDPAKANRPDEKQSRLRKSNQSHEQQAKHNDQSDWVACQEATSFNAKRNHQRRMRFRVVLDRLPHIECLSIPPTIYTPRTRILKRACTVAIRELVNLYFLDRPKKHTKLNME